MIEYKKYLDSYKSKIITYHFHRNFCIRKDESIAENNISRFSCNPVTVYINRRMDRKFIGIYIIKLAHLVR